jgi:hypothetical protein
MSLLWTSTTNTTAAILKELYPVERVQMLGFTRNPFFGMVRKNTSLGGYDAKIPVDVATVQAGSATFAAAQTQAAAVSSTSRAFSVTAVKSYSLARIGGMMIRSANANMKAFVNALDHEVSSAFLTFGRRMEKQLLGDGTGFIGRAKTSSSGYATTCLITAWSSAPWTAAAARSAPAPTP